MCSLGLFKARSAGAGSQAALLRGSVGGYFILTDLQHLPQVVLLYSLHTISSILFSHLILSQTSQRNKAGNPHTGPGGIPILVQVLGVTHP